VSTLYFLGEHLLQRSSISQHVMTPLSLRSYDAFHEAVPWRPVGGGESASCVADRGEYGPSNGTTGHVGSSASFYACVATAWSEAATRDFVFGNFAWTGQDYYVSVPARESGCGQRVAVVFFLGHLATCPPACRVQGETYPLGWPDVSSHFGILDLAGFPKDSAVSESHFGILDLAGFPKDAAVSESHFGILDLAGFPKDSAVSESRGALRGRRVSAPALRLKPLPLLEFARVLTACAGLLPCVVAGGGIAGLR
jgi:hypothetical protein